MSRRILLALVTSVLCAQLPHPLPNGYDLPNGWRITPAGKSVPTEDMVLNLSPAPDGKAVIAMHSGFNPHGLVVVNAATDEVTQRIGLKSTWFGLAWHPNGKQLFASGGNANGRKATLAPVYVFDYANGKLSDKPVRELVDKMDPALVLWSGLAHHPHKAELYAANRGTAANTPGYVAVFDSKSGEIKTRITVEINPYDLVLSPDGKMLYVSNWASDSVSVIDTEARRVVSTIKVGDNPNDMELSADGRLFVSCANDNSIVVIDTKTRVPVERISTALTSQSPEGSTPNSLTIDRENGMLFVANADNNNVAVVSIKVPGKSEVLGFIPTGWYPSSVTVLNRTKQPKLYVGNSKGLGGWSTERGPHSPLADDGRPEGRGSSKSLQKGTVEMISLSNLRTDLKAWTKQVYENVPYKDEYLARAKAPTTESVVPREVGAGSPIKHIIYIIRENRTYDQVLGDMKKGNGDPRIAIFGEKVTPNGHAIADQFVLFDNLYCDGEVSVDGHSWSNSAYATDFNEKLWPITYGGHSKASPSMAHVPGAGSMWDLARRKGLTYRSYGEYTTRESDGTKMEAIPAAAGLMGHVSPKFKLPKMRDTDNVKVFIDEFDEYEKQFDSKDPNDRLPNFIVMSLPEDHTRGTRPGDYTPRAMVANNDYAVGMLVDRVTHSKYWPETAIFIIEDDAQDGSDHVDARRTVGLVISPYIKRGTVDSTLYTTSGFLRTMQLLLGLPPMSQYDAAATPMYNAFGTTADLTPYVHKKPQIEVSEKNLKTAYGAKKSMKMDLDEVDEAPMFAFNEIIWKSVMGAASPMPAPVHRFRFHSQAPRAGE